MRFTVVTILPELVEPALAAGVVGRAREAGVIAVDTVNPRDFTTDRHRTVDDTPYGGGPGMVMKPEPLLAAIGNASTPSSRRILLTPAGAPLTQARVKELAALDHLVLVCGRYEGIDERVIELAIDEELSLGDYVLSGGELGALVIIDAVARLVPGVLGEPTSADDESHAAGLLEYPQYTRPLKLVVPATSAAPPTSEPLASITEAAVPTSAASTTDVAPTSAAVASTTDLAPTNAPAASTTGAAAPTSEVAASRILEVPAILTSGNHAAIASWRRQQGLLRTARRRPDLFAQHALTPAERKLLPPPLATRTHLALVHHPCVDRTGKIVTTSLTNFDIHDLARSTATYGLAAYHIVTPITSQREKAEHIASLWLEETAARKPPATGSRAGALSRVRTADSVETVIAELTADYGIAPIVVGTSARPESFPGVPRRSPTELVAEAVPGPAPLLILLGTGWGLADHLIPSVSRVLAPIEGGSDWNHLSVRSAGAILLDRMFDRTAVTRRVGPA